MLDIINKESEFMHHGVKGMKWGVRKDRFRYNQLMRTRSYYSMTNNKKAQTAIQNKIRKLDKKFKKQNITPVINKYKKEKVYTPKAQIAYGLGSIGALTGYYKLVHMLPNTMAMPLAAGYAAANVISSIIMNLKFAKKIKYPQYKFSIDNKE